MEELFYEMIFKRKSFHTFKNTGDETISDVELSDIRNSFEKLEFLVSDIKIKMEIVPGDETTCRRGQEYCILFYSEKKENCLQNIGYIGEQVDLLLASMDIGCLWFGLGKTELLKNDGLDFIIMMAIKKVPSDKFRRDMFKSRRKTLEEMWQGDYFTDIGNIARFSPSSCNLQPWLVESSEKELLVYRYKQKGKRGIIPSDRVIYANRADIGIFLFILEQCIKHKKLKYKRVIYNDSKDPDDTEKVLVARYYEIG